MCVSEQALTWKQENSQQQMDTTDNPPRFLLYTNAVYQFKCYSITNHWHGDYPNNCNMHCTKLGGKVWREFCSFIIQSNRIDLKPKKRFESKKE